MLSQGYVKFSRGWKHHPESPVYGPRYHKYYQVWRELCEQAGYSDELGMVKAQVTVVLSDLGKTLELPKTTCFNAITYLRDHGMIEVDGGKRSLRVIICHYDALDCVDSYLKILHQKTSRKSDVSENEKRSGTIHIAPNYSEQLDNVDGSKTIWNDAKTSGTIMERNGGDLMKRNDSEKTCFKKPRGTDLERTRDILKNKEEIHTHKINLMSSSRRLAHKRKSPTAPTDFQVRVATAWQEAVTKRLRSNLVTLEEQIEALRVFQEKVGDAVSEDLIEQTLAWAATNSYWRGQLRNLKALLAKYPRNKTITNFEQASEEAGERKSPKEKPRQLVETPIEDVI